MIGVTLVLLVAACFAIDPDAPEEGERQGLIQGDPDRQT